MLGARKSRAVFCLPQRAAPFAAGKDRSARIPRRSKTAGKAAGLSCRRSRQKQGVSGLLKNVEKQCFPTFCFVRFILSVAFIFSVPKNCAGWRRKKGKFCFFEENAQKREGRMSVFRSIQIGFQQKTARHGMRRAVGLQSYSDLPSCGWAAYFSRNIGTAASKSRIWGRRYSSSSNSA